MSEENLAVFGATWLSHALEQKHNSPSLSRLSDLEPLLNELGLRYLLWFYGFYAIRV